MISQNNTIESQLRRGMLEIFTLLIINEQELYPFQIIEKAKSADLILVEGTLYPLLARLKAEKKLDSKWVESPTGPPRKYYFMTPFGRQILNQSISFVNKLNLTFNQLQSITE
ncbi:MAG: helix-turn-helix transcriptional regulator [Candidatus Parcubacteria bacterium]|nr:helix-turn-helix transcriptional regulator [Candidatus Paceibacterota bacterium]